MVITYKPFPSPKKKNETWKRERTEQVILLLSNELLENLTILCIFEESIPIVYVFIPGILCESICLKMGLLEVSVCRSTDQDCLSFVLQDQSTIII